jgi:hypothetical protein
VEKNERLLFFKVILRRLSSVLHSFITPQQGMDEQQPPAPLLQLPCHFAGPCPCTSSWFALT